MTAFERFENLLAEKGVRAAEVARATGITPSTFSDWKKGKSSPKMEKLQKLAEYFDVSVNYFSDKQFEKWDATLNADGKLSKESILIETAKQTGDAYARLLTYFQMLNADGQQKALEELEDLTEHPRYKGSVQDDNG